jgi:hypothetical protein
MATEQTHAQRSASMFERARCALEQFDALATEKVAGSAELDVTLLRRTVAAVQVGAVVPLDPALGAACERVEQLCAGATRV